MFTAGEILLIVATAALISSLILVQLIYVRSGATPRDSATAGGAGHPRGEPADSDDERPLEEPADSDDENSAAT